MGCKYKLEKQNELFEKLKQKIENLEQKMWGNVKTSHAKNFEQECLEMERKVKKQQQEIDEKSAQIACLELKLEKLEKKFTNEKKAKDKNKLELSGAKLSSLS